MNDLEIQSRLKGYIKQINSEHRCNFRLLLVINLLAFILQEKDWFDKLKTRDVVVNILKDKIKEFNEIIQKSNNKYYDNLINLFHTKSELFLTEFD